MHTRGFHDAHLHALSLAWHQKYAKSLYALSSPEAIIEAMSIESSEAQPVLFGRGWDEQHFSSPSDRLKQADLNSISTTLPVVCVRVCGHAALVNSLAMERICALEEAAPYLEQGLIDSEQGLLYEDALYLFAKLYPRPSEAEIKECILTALRYLASLGITSIQTDDLQSYPGADYRQILQAYHALDREGALPERVHIQASFASPKELFAALEDPLLAYASPMFSVASIKIYQDGSLGSRTAYLKTPYTLKTSYADSAFDALTNTKIKPKPNARTKNQGILHHSKESLEEQYLACSLKGFQVITHCIGDGALEMALDTWERIWQKRPELYKDGAHGHGFNHVQIALPRDIDRMGKLGFAAYVQPAFIDLDRNLAEELLKDRPEGLSGCYAWRTMAEAGVPLLFSSDAPIISADPLRMLYSAITRRTSREESGQDAREAWLPEECVDAELAWYAAQEGGFWALAPAYASQAAGDCIALAVPEAAPGGASLRAPEGDLAIATTPTALSPEQLLGSRVCASICAGKVSYDASETQDSHMVNEGYAHIEGLLNLAKTQKYHNKDYNLNNVREFLDYLGNPQDSYEIIHVAGSKGKGSVATYIARSLRALRACNVGLYTSPHVRDYRERISLAGDAIPDALMAPLMKDFLTKLEAYGKSGHRMPTTFESLTALALLVYKELGCRYVVLEVGLGGLLDATNVVTPIASVINLLEIEHSMVLGSTIEEIAYQKGGIIKPKVPSYVGHQNEARANACLATIAAERASQQLQIDALSQQRLYELMDYASGLRAWTECAQKQNVALAALVLEDLGFIATPDDKARVKHCLSQTRLLGRGQIISRADMPPLMLDVAHTEASMRAGIAAFAAYLAEQRAHDTSTAHDNSKLDNDLTAHDNLTNQGSATLVFGAVAGKHHVEMVELLVQSGLFAHIIVTTPGWFKESDPEALYELVASRITQSNQGARLCQAEFVPQPADALKKAQHYKKPLLITGSFYLAGEIMKALDAFKQAKEYLQESKGAGRQE